MYKYIYAYRERDIESILGDKSVHLVFRFFVCLFVCENLNLFAIVTVSNKTSRL